MPSPGNLCALKENASRIDDDNILITLTSSAAAAIVGAQRQ